MWRAWQLSCTLTYDTGRTGLHCRCDHSCRWCESHYRVSPVSMSATFCTPANRWFPWQQMCGIRDKVEDVPHHLVGEGGRTHHPTAVVGGKDTLPYCGNSYRTCSCSTAVQSDAVQVGAYRYAKASHALMYTGAYTRLGGLIGVSWARLGISWAGLRISWARLWARLRISWTRLGISWARLWARLRISWTRLGISWARLWARLGVSHARPRTMNILRSILS